MDGPKYPHQIVVRVSDQLYDLIVEDAQRHGRNVGQTVRFRLQIAYGMRDADPGASAP